MIMPGGEALSLDGLVAEKRAKLPGKMRRARDGAAIVASQANTARTGLAAIAWTSRCADPPMQIMCINRSAGAHAVIRSADALSVSFSSESEQETVPIFSAQKSLDGRLARAVSPTNVATVKSMQNRIEGRGRSPDHVSREYCE
jgi:flavin reductase